MYPTNENIKEALQDAIREFNSTDFTKEASAHYLLGYLRGTIHEVLLMMDRMEMDEKYRQQEEQDFLNHLG